MIQTALPIIYHIRNILYYTITHFCLILVNSDDENGALAIAVKH